MDIHLHNHILWKILYEIKTSTVFVHKFLPKLGRLIGGVHPVEALGEGLSGPCRPDQRCGKWLPASYNREILLMLTQSFFQAQIKEAPDEFTPRKGPVTRKMFTFDDVIMKWGSTICSNSYLCEPIQIGMAPSSSYMMRWSYNAQDSKHELYATMC